MSARDRILDTFETILISEGERATTLDTIAAKARVSKGGLLYHFRGREALVLGLVERAEALTADYLEMLRTSPDGATTAYVRTSAETDSALDHTLIALSRLGGDQHPEAAAMLRRAQEGWSALVRDEVGDAATADAILLIGDGLYYNALLQGAAQYELDRLLRLVERLKAAAAAG